MVIRVDRFVFGAVLCAVFGSVFSAVLGVLHIFVRILVCAAVHRIVFGFIIFCHFGLPPGII